MFCPVCSAPNRDDAKFCKKCGQPLHAEAAKAPEAVAINSVAAPASTPGSVEAAPAQGNLESYPVEGTTGNAENGDDISLAPTQFLTPGKMAAHHNRHWQQDSQQEQEDIPAPLPEEQPAKGTSIADAPTIPISSTPLQNQQSRDIADIPTVEMAPLKDAETQSSASGTPPSSTTEPAPPLETTQPEQSSQSGKADIDVDTTDEMGAAKDAAHQGEESMQESSDVGARFIAPDGTNVEAQSVAPKDPDGEIQSSVSGGAAPTDDFAVLAVGTTVGGRYEITSLVNETPQEHVYQVTDSQGYQHCWNCGSEQNSEGDEFCIDCGAGLLGAPYIMHEYAPTALAPNVEENVDDGHVLQGNIVNTFVDAGHTYVIEQPQVVENVFPNGVHLLAAGNSDAGDVRRSEPNEDSVLVLLLERVHESIAAPSGVFIVADGLGGHDSGQVASRTTINIIAERMVRELLAAPLASEKEGEAAKSFDEDALVTMFHGAIEDANTVLCQMNARDKTDMGSTITGFLVVGDLAYIINVGDSRTYMLRGGQLYQLTSDHSLVAQLVAGGLIEPDDIYTHPQRSQIFRSLGDKMNVQIDVFKQQLHPGDTLLSCSDGLWEMIRNPQIESILNAVPNPQIACTQLIEAANANGGEDNVSAVVVFVQ